MRFTLHLNDSCQRLSLRPGARITCAGGTLWITLESRQASRPSPDLVLTPGQCHRVTEAADYFLTGTRKDVATACEIDLSREQRPDGRPLLALRRALQGRGDPLRRLLRA
ncbi:DUF2917 domain-containing protein [Azohydromonas caseinilytica]|uniref:DUF2917 domain-containing protein n=1 Tax=Azohydromonas caseinilytica TaxID=2728836 RepID=A0A848FAN3_9BURK|nr:DUF2917 domain-containing protein [Azohydromonas caseinilytica]NML17247.1 DUF2917 domain-containing protein [Azohydromonas caseinilytica]